MGGEAQGGKTAFVFDLDGTLVDSMPGIGSSLSAAFRSIGRVMPAGSLREAIGPPIREIAKRLEPGLLDDETAAIERAYRSLYDEGGWRETDLFPGVMLGLETLREDGHRLFVATNKPRTPTMKILEHLGLSALVNDVVTRDSGEPRYVGKSEMLSTLIEKHGLGAENCMMVGDTAEDGEAARANGLRFVFVTYGYGEAAEADYRLDSFEALLGIEAPASVFGAGGEGR